MILTDIHCHLYDLPDPDTAITEAVAAGVSRFLAVSEDIATARKALELKNRHPDHVLAGVGIHPANLLTLSDDGWDETLEVLDTLMPEADVMGEIGLDYKMAQSEEKRALQQKRLEDQFILAEKYSLPVNLHSRRALRQTMERAIAFHERSGLPTLLHWFAHSKKLIRRTNEAGIFISAGPTILFSDEALDVVLTVDPDLILTETDTPVPYNGEPARPSWTARVADRLVASHPDITVERLEINTRRYLSGELL